MPVLNSIRAVLFDAVGTLIYADPPAVDVYHLAGWQYGSQLTREEIAKRFHAAMAASFNPKPQARASADIPVASAVAFGTGLNEADGGELLRLPTSEAHERQRWRQIVTNVFDDIPDAGGPPFHTLWNHFADPEHWQLFGDVPPVLSAFAESGLMLGIASNFDRRLLKIQAGLPELRLCQRCFVSSEVGYSKPDPRFFAAVQAQLGLPPRELLLIGDDWANDIVGARAAGWQAIHLDRQGKAGRREGVKSLGELLA